MALKHSEMLQGLQNSQDSDKDNREMVQEADDFINKRGGMWEQHIWSNWKERPRYTFDEVNPVIDGIMGEMDAMDFAVAVDPNGGGSTVELAQAYGGIVRSIENMSKARYIYKHASRVMTATGLAGWRVIPKERPFNPFVQDLVIDPLYNFKERVWFDEGCTERDASDADHIWVLTSIPLTKYEEEFPEGSGISVGRRDYYSSNYWRRFKNDNVVVGEWYERRYVKKEYVLMNNDKVYEVNDEFNAVKDELEQVGLIVVDRKEVKEPCFWHRVFDGADWLGESEKTVFRVNPVVPAYANYDISEDTIIYWGVVEKLMDPQRILNYAESKKVAESALKPVEKTWITKDQAQSDDVMQSLADSNTNSDPHQFYDHVDGQAPPYRQPPSQPDAVLMETAASSKQYIKDTSNYNDAVRGVGLSGQSGETVERLQNKGNIGNFKYFTAMEIAIGRTAEILVDTIPRIYDTPQEMSLINLDGSKTQYNILETIYDDESGQFVTINDLSVGNYQVSCSAGTAFQSRQKESARSMIEAATVYPAIMEMGSDVFLRSLDNPALSTVADRMRMKLLEAGAIPVTEMTDEEKQYLQAKQATAQPDPIEQANLGLAQAEIKKAEAMTMDVLSKIEERQEKSDLALEKMVAEIMLKQEELLQKRDEKLMNAITAQADVLSKHIASLKTLKETTGAEAVIAPSLVDTLSEQIDIVQEHQDNQQ